MSILSHFHEYSPRPQQEEALRFVERVWDSSDVIVLQLPVAVGKSNVGMAIARWAHKEKKKHSNILVPTNVLLEQYKSSFPRLHSLQRKDLYRCPRLPAESPLEDTNCDWRKKAMGEFCEGCCYLKAVRQSHVVPYMTCNYWTYMAHKLYKPVVIMDECFPKETLVRLSNGKTQSIGEIVRRFSKGEEILVSAWNGSEFVSRRVKNAWCSGKRELVEVTTPAGTIRCTPSHRFLTVSGYKEAQLLTQADRIICEVSRTGLRKLTDAQQQIVAGSCLGDGHIHRDSHCKHGVRLSIRHSKKQLEYLKFKADILGIEVKLSGKSGYTGEAQYVCQTKYIDFSDKKQDSLRILGPLGLAVWFCDDGSLGKNSKGEVNQGRFHVESWNMDDIIFAQNILLHTFGISTALQFYKKEKNYPLLTLNKENMTKLLKIIETYIPDCMAYKRGQFPGPFNPQHITEEGVFSAKVLPVEEVKETADSENVYDIEVEDLHNFVVVTHRSAKSGMVVHNCHNLLNIIRDLEGKRLWRKDYLYPRSIQTYGDLLKWVEAHPRRDADPKLKLLSEELSTGRQHYLVEQGEDLYRGREEECLKLLPIDVRNAKPYMWPTSGKNRVEKLVLMSATFTPIDLEMLGLTQRRVAFLETGSPIEPARRPVHFEPITNSSFQFQNAAIPKLAQFLRELADARPGTKGFVHTTYAMSAKLEALLVGDRRFKFHEAEDKMERYREWRASDPASAQVFVGCGMSEGLDLKGPDYGWQVLTKAPYPSLAEPAIRFQAETRPQDYAWTAMREAAQACGRICRDPSDFGETYLIDVTFKKLFRQAHNHGILPKWLREQLMNTEDLGLEEA